MVLKGVNWVHNAKNQVIWSSKDSIVYTNGKIRSNGLERSQLGTQCKNQVKCS